MFEVLVCGLWRYGLCNLTPFVPVSYTVIAGSSLQVGLVIRDVCSVRLYTMSQK